MKCTHDDLALLVRAMAKGVVHLVPVMERGYVEVRVDGKRHITVLDCYGCPEMNIVIRHALEEALKPTPIAPPRSAPVNTTPRIDVQA